MLAFFYDPCKIKKVVTALPNPVGIWVSFRGFINFNFNFNFSVSVKVLPVTPLLSGVFVHRVFCAYFVRFEGAGVMRRFPWCTDGFNKDIEGIKHLKWISDLCSLHSLQVKKKKDWKCDSQEFVVCFKKYFAGKGGLYEFIMFCNMRA